jgi:superfamily II DNA or RNA helicase
MVIDEERLKIQTDEVDKFIAAGGVGAGEYPTGFGKTFMAFLAIQRFRKDKQVDVVVPTQPLKDQWEELISQKLSDYKIDVFIVNSYVQKRRSCDFLILDEAHRFSNESAKVFNKVLDNCDFKYVWCLSAKFTKEQILFLNLRDIKLLNSISVQTAKQNNWVSNFVVYNLKVQLTEGESTAYTTASNTIKSNFPYFNNDLNLVFKLINKTNKQELKRYCEENGFDEKDLQFRGVKITRAIASRKAIVFNSELKKQAIKELATKFKDRKIILFSQTINSAKEYKKVIDEKTVIYHSNLKEIEKRKALEDISNSKVRIILSAKALEEGLDVKDLDFGIAASYNSTERGMIQTLGRIIRYTNPEKRAIFVNLYCEDTVEVGWLKSRQKGFNQIRWVSNIESIC